MLARPPALCFSRKFLCFRFSRSLKAIKRHLAWFVLSFPVVNVVKTIFVTMKLRLHKGRSSPAGDNLALPLIFFNLLRWNLSEFSKFEKIVLPIINKPKKRGYKGSFLAILKKIFISDEAMARNIWDSTYLMLRLSTVIGKRTLWVFHR